MTIKNFIQIYSTHMSTAERGRNFHLLQRMLDLHFTLVKHSFVYCCVCNQINDKAVQIDTLNVMGV